MPAAATTTIAVPATVTNSVVFLAIPILSVKHRQHPILRLACFRNTLQLPRVSQFLRPLENQTIAMNAVITEKADWKHRLAHEMLEYSINFFYLAFFFGAFTWYRRLILAEYQITYLHYGVAIIEALILAKVVLLGDAVHLGREFEGKPLIFPTLYKAVLFSLFVGAFAIGEHSIEGWLHGKGFAGGFREIVNEGKDELLARCLLTFFAFVPFFAFRELGRVMGDGKIISLFFSHRPPSSRT
jgi:hypothetical protein